MGPDGPAWRIPLQHPLTPVILYVCGAWIGCVALFLVLLYVGLAWAALAGVASALAGVVGWALAMTVSS